MRNLLQYPVTHDEKINLLDRLIEQFLEDNRIKGTCGDMRATILRAIRRDVEENAE